MVTLSTRGDVTASAPHPSKTIRYSVKDLNMRWLFLVAAVVGCGESRVGVQFSNVDMRTADAVNTEGSCGCPAGHTLYCDGRSGAEEPLGADTCEVIGVGDEQAVFYIETLSPEPANLCDFDTFLANNDIEAYEQRAREVMFCNPI